MHTFSDPHTHIFQDDSFKKTQKVPSIPSPEERLSCSLPPDNPSGRCVISRRVSSSSSKAREENKWGKLKLKVRFSMSLVFDFLHHYSVFELGFPNISHYCRPSEPSYCSLEESGLEDSRWVSSRCVCLSRHTWISMEMVLRHWAQVIVCKCSTLYSPSSIFVITGKLDWGI